MSFAAQCFSKTVALVSTEPGSSRETDPREDPSTFLGAVTAAEETSWSVDLRLNEEAGYKRAAPRAEAIFKNGVTHTSCMVNFASSRQPTIIHMKSTVNRR